MAVALQEDVEVWAVNEEAFTLFLDFQTQWRCLIGWAGMVFLGLPYETLIAQYGGPLPRRLLDQIQTAEHAALKILNEARP